MHNSLLRFFGQLTPALGRTKCGGRMPGISIVLLALAMFLLSVNVAHADPSPFDSPATSEAGANRVKLSTAKEYFLRGSNESESKNYETAIADFDDAIRLQPNYAEAFGNRGAAKFNIKDYQGALNDYNAALKVFPENQALINLKVQAEQAIAEQAIAEQANQASRAAAINQIRSQAALGGDFADPSTMIMRNAQQKGLVPSGGDLSDPATIIMMNAKRRGLIPQNTPNP